MDANTIFHQLLPMIPFEPVYTTHLLEATTEDLLQSLRAATYTFFTSKCQVFQYAPHLLQDLQDATSSYYYLKTVYSFHTRYIYNHQTHRALLDDILNLPFKPGPPPRPYQKPVWCSCILKQQPTTGHDYLRHV